MAAENLVIGGRSSFLSYGSCPWQSPLIMASSSRCESFGLIHSLFNDSGLGRLRRLEANDYDTGISISDGQHSCAFATQAMHLWTY